MDLTFILSICEGGVKFGEIEFTNIENTDTAKLLISILIDISKSQKWISLVIFLHSDSNLVLFAEIESADSGPDIIELQIMFELHIEKTVLIIAQLDVFLYVAPAVHAGLKVEALVRELQFYFV
jgi:hypothetical protein